MIDENKAKQSGYLDLYNWIKKVQREWEDKTDQSLTAIEWLNYRNKIEEQDSSCRYKVLYLTSGKNIASCLVDLNEEILEKEVDGTRIPLKGFVADYKTYYYETNDKDEAYYLTSLLNSPYVNELIKGLQSKGLFGERDICKKVLDLPIPKFDSSNENHKRLAELGKKCRIKAYEEMPKWCNKYKAIAWVRKGLRDDMADELEEISNLAVRVLGG